MDWEEWHMELANKIRRQILNLIDTARECAPVSPPTVPSDISPISEQNIQYFDPETAHLVWTVNNKRD